MDSLAELINELRSNPSPYVKDNNGLIDSLIELQSMIGHHRLKQSVALQTKHLIKMLSDPAKRSQYMLNTIIYGPPGVGKTMVGKVLSKIWYNLGYLKSNNITLSSAADKLEINELTRLLILVYLVTIGYYIFQMATNAMKISDIGVKNKRIISLVLIILVILAGIYVTSRLRINSPVKKAISDGSSDKSAKSNDIIRVVSRPDFISGYLGQTDKKTNDLLNSAIGKVLFIDEAYSLYSGDKDPYGIEALDSINKFLSEHPDEIIVIMAGYKDKMNRLFELQPGLRRRFMWTFECDGYTADELYRILIQHLNKNGWRVEDTDGLQQLIEDNYNLFTEYGGDMEKLAFYSQLNSKDFTLSMSDFRNGLEMLKINKIKSAKHEVSY